MRRVQISCDICTLFVLYEAVWDNNKCYWILSLVHIHQTLKALFLGKKIRALQEYLSSSCRHFQQKNSVENLQMSDKLDRYSTELLKY